jgi:membrane-associated phospholipid phosphatase
MRKTIENKQFLYDFFSKTKYFLIFYSFLLIIGSLPFIFSTDESISLWVNKHHNATLDLLFKYTTFLGDGLFYGIALAPMLLSKVRWSIAAFISYLFTGMIAQILKHLFEMPRPRHFFAGLDLNFVDGVTLYSNFSFPSGHTTSAFSLFLILSFLLPKDWLNIFFLLLAVMVGLSRVYLMQHFYIDIYFGSIIGVVFTIFVFYFFQKIKSNDQEHWLNKPIHKISIK